MKICSPRFGGVLSRSGFGVYRPSDTALSSFGFRFVILFPTGLFLFLVKCNVISLRRLHSIAVDGGLGEFYIATLYVKAIVR